MDFRIMSEFELMLLLKSSLSRTEDTKVCFTLIVYWLDMNCVRAIASCIVSIVRQ